MSTAQVIDLRDYRERREGRSPGQHAGASGSVEQGFAFLAVPFPVPVLVACFPFWIVMPILLVNGHRDA